MREPTGSGSAQSHTTEGSLRRQSTIAAAGLCMIAAVGWVDQATGGEISFSIFYVLPVTFVVWWGGLNLGIAAAFASAAAWGAADAQAHTYSHPSILVWNATVRLFVFLTIGFLLVRLRQARDAERALARTDALTGAANSRAFYDRLELEIARSRRKGHPFGLVYFDLDGFKLVNDAQGHLIGDQLLQTVAKCAQHEIRQTDLLARLGGDEFAVLLSDTQASGTSQVVSKLRAALLAEMARLRSSVTFSFGAATFHEPPASGRQAIQLVDELMYRVKAKGKNGAAHETIEPSTRPGQSTS